MPSVIQTNSVCKQLFCEQLGSAQRPVETMHVANLNVAAGDSVIQCRQLVCPDGVVLNSDTIITDTYFFRGTYVRLDAISAEGVRKGQMTNFRPSLDTPLDWETILISQTSLEGNELKQVNKLNTRVFIRSQSGYEWEYIMTSDSVTGDYLGLTLSLQCKTTNAPIGEIIDNNDEFTMEVYTEKQTSPNESFIRGLNCSNVSVSKNLESETARVVKEMVFGAEKDEERTEFGPYQLKPTQVILNPMPKGDVFVNNPLSYYSVTFIAYSTTSLNELTTITNATVGDFLMLSLLYSGVNILLTYEIEGPENVVGLDRVDFGDPQEGMGIKFVSVEPPDTPDHVLNTPFTIWDLTIRRVQNQMIFSSTNGLLYKAVHHMFKGEILPLSPDLENIGSFDKPFNNLHCDNGVVYCNSVESFYANHEESRILNLLVANNLYIETLPTSQSIKLWGNYDQSLFVEHCSKMVVLSPLEVDDALTVRGKSLLKDLSVSGNINSNLNMGAYGLRTDEFNTKLVEIQVFGSRSTDNGKVPFDYLTRLYTAFEQAPTYNGYFVFSLGQVKNPGTPSESYDVNDRVKISGSGLTVYGAIQATGSITGNAYSISDSLDLPSNASEIIAGINRLSDVEASSPEAFLSYEEGKYISQCHLNKLLLAAVKSLIASSEHTHHLPEDVQRLQAQMTLLQLGTAPTNSPSHAALNSKVTQLETKLAALEARLNALTAQ